LAAKNKKNGFDKIDIGTDLLGTKNGKKKEVKNEQRKRNRL